MNLIDYKEYWPDAYIQAVREIEDPRIARAVARRVITYLNEAHSHAHDIDGEEAARACVERFILPPRKRRELAGFSPVGSSFETAFRTLPEDDEFADPGEIEISLPPAPEDSEKTGGHEEPETVKSRSFLRAAGIGLSAILVNKILWHAISFFVHSLIVISAVVVAASMGTKPPDEPQFFTTVAERIENDLDSRTPDKFRDILPRDLEDIAAEPVEVPEPESGFEEEALEPDIDFEPFEAEPDIDLADEFGAELPGNSDLPADIFDEAKGVGDSGSSGKEDVYFGRGKGRGKLTYLGGGGKETELAVELALAWLYRHQHWDGSWSTGYSGECDVLPGCDGQFSARSEYRPSMTGLALLCFLGAGYTDLVVTGEGPGALYADAIRKGLQYLMFIQVDGRFSTNMYEHSIATMAMAEAFGMTNRTEYGASAKLALEAIYASQHDDGGWRYRVARAPVTGVPGWFPDRFDRSSSSDSSVSGWVVMALKCLTDAGVEIKKNVIDGLNKWFESCTEQSYYKVSYQPGRQGTRRLTAVGLVAGVFFGDEGKLTKFRLQASYCCQDPPAWNAARRDFYFWYYATIGVFQAGGTYWKTWNHRMKAALTSSQHKKGCKTGSWDFDKSPYGTSLGRVYSTAIACLCLEVYYRYKRVLPKKKQDR